MLIQGNGEGDKRVEIFDLVSACELHLDGGIQPVVKCNKQHRLVPATLHRKNAEAHWIYREGGRALAEGEQVLTA